MKNGPNISQAYCSCPQRDITGQETEKGSLPELRRLGWNTGVMRQLKSAGQRTGDESNAKRNTPEICIGAAQVLGCEETT